MSFLSSSDPVCPGSAARIEKGFKKWSLAKLFPDAAAGSVLRWGLATAADQPVSPLQAALCQLASGQPTSRWRGDAVDWELAAEELLRDIDDTCLCGRVDLRTASEAVLWAYALPPLRAPMQEASWRALCQGLDRLARHCQQIPDPAAPVRLIGGGELALVMRLRLGELVAEVLAGQAVDGLRQWCDSGEPAIGAAVRGQGRSARLVLASLLRQRRLIAVVTKQKLKQAQLGTLIELGGWVAALTRRDGTAVFSSLSRGEVREDWQAGGLFAAIRALEPHLLGPAVDVVLGERPSGGRLAWEISLPETLWHSELAGVAALLPQWDMRRGRMFVDYAGEDFCVELQCGRHAVVAGNWEAAIAVDGSEQAAAGPWMHVCEYSDDDAQYLEFEQDWTGGVRLQRQIMVLRDDRCVLLADAVLREEGQPSAVIDYFGRLPLTDRFRAEAEAETTEFWLRDAKGQRRVMVLSPLASEWRGGRTAARLELSADGNFKLHAATAAGSVNGGGVFAPLWFDFQRRRFDRPRTWRQLTVADELRIVAGDEAVAQRIQCGSEQWVLYRSLRGERTRTFLGKHLLADFYCARFHPGDGRMEDLLTVGDHDEDLERTAAEAAAEGAGGVG